MNKWSDLSKTKLEECDVRLQMLFNKVLEQYDCQILCGHRNEEDQNKAFEQRRSKLRYPKSKHNKTPSLAVDVAPYPFKWSETSKFYFFAGHVLATAHHMGLKVRFGGDWDMDKEIYDQSFMDLVHFELMED